MKMPVIGVVVFLASAAHGAEQKIQCPVRYPVQSVKLAEVPKGWDGKGKVGANLLLSGGGVFTGSDEDRAELMGGASIKTKEGHEVTYPLTVGEKWFFCNYGGGGIELLHRIAASATQCVVKTKRVKPGENPDVSISCK
ncbi:STY0301 family protein [Massilia sp. CCM 8734]|uniref:STY0301 family protein n=1 Tax=Massilia sp. CCM 8734 TaxID=2609283 RepID=UPI0014220108|nr:STY0301 family protein [Massilia sp. CCM 8734]NHZ96169.1 hypothetical protein [Massilia sp. CCM 8734]